MQLLTQTQQKRACLLLKTSILLVITQELRYLMKVLKFCTWCI